MRIRTRLLLTLMLALMVLPGAGSLHGADDAADQPLPRNLTQEFLLDKYATTASAFAYVNRTLLHYRDEGKGLPVVLIHGSLQDLYDWDPWVKELSSSYRVIRFDMPGAGLTGRVQSGDYSITNTMRTLDELLDRLGERRVAVVGTSLGGIVAFRYAATRRERVAALVLMNSAGVEWGNEKIIPPQPQRYNESLADTIRRSSLQTILNAVLPDASKIPLGRLERGLDYQRRENRNLEAAAIVDAYDRGAPSQMLGRITAPTLVLWGGENRALDPGVADEFLRLLTCTPLAEKAVVPGAGHWPHVEAPSQSVRFVGDFLAQHYVEAEGAPDQRNDCG
jgi:pimeloyl-ACP methyl ester carboxylesterase